MARVRGWIGLAVVSFFLKVFRLTQQQMLVVHVCDASLAWVSDAVLGATACGGGVWCVSAMRTKS